MQHAVIMAGGSGTRLWPLSTDERPKQLLKLFYGKSLLRLSFERLAGFLPPDQIYVITNRKHLNEVAAELPELPRANLFGEPCPRDTAAAVGLAAHLIAARDPQGIMGVFTADHVTEPVDHFCRIVQHGYAAAEQYADALVTFGVKPTGPHTGYGYIHRGRALAPSVYEIRAFKEKPDRLTAGMYVAGGEYYWNSGMFVWRIPTILEQFEKLQPEMSRSLQGIAGMYNDPARQEGLARQFSELTRISVDFAIMEKAPRVICVEMDCRWMDVGSWTSLAEILPPDAAGNTSSARRTCLLDARNNIIVSETDHLIAAIGVEDLVIVHGDRATLICRKSDAQRVKELVDKLPK